MNPNKLFGMNLVEHTQEFICELGPGVLLWCDCYERPPADFDRQVMRLELCAGAKCRLKMTRLELTLLYIPCGPPSPRTRDLQFEFFSHKALPSRRLESLSAGGPSSEGRTCGLIILAFFVIFKHPMLLSLDWRALGRVPGLDVVFDLLQAGRHLVVLHPVHLKHSFTYLICCSHHLHL